MDFNISLEGDMLVKVDRSSMLASLECRAPFLNDSLVKFSFSLPSEFLIHNGNLKYILKETFEDMLPKNLFNLSKKGFGVPVGDWLRDYLKDDLQKYSTYDFIQNQNLFNFDFVNKLVNEHLNGKVDNTFKLWTYYCFQKWYSNNF